MEMVAITVVAGSGRTPMDASGFSMGVSGVMGGLADSSGSYSKTSWILPSVGEKSGDRGLSHWMLRGHDMFDVVFAVVTCVRPSVVVGR
jgi:hypothetical protein